MPKNTMKIAVTALRIIITIIFILSLFAIDFDNPKDIVSITTLQRLTNPAVLSHVVLANLGKVTRLILDNVWQLSLLALIVHLLCIVILTLRWQLMLKVQSIKIGFFRLFAYYLIGFFFNNFLPTNIGGDVSRVYNAGKKTGKMAESFAIVFLERFLGFIAVFFLAFVALAFNLEWISDRSILMALTAFGVGILFTTVVLFSNRTRKKVKRLILKIGFLSLNEKLTRAYQSIYLFKNNLKTLWIVLALSFLYQFILVGVNLLAAHSVGATPPIFPVFFVIQITTLICVIPISINGLGVREYFYVQILGLSGVAADKIMAFQIILFAIMYIESLAGGFFFLLQRSIKSARKRRANGAAQIMANEAKII